MFGPTHVSMFKGSASKLTEWELVAWKKLPETILGTLRRNACLLDETGDGNVQAVVISPGPMAGSRKTGQPPLSDSKLVP